MTEIEDVIESCVEDIWEKFKKKDTDNLSKAETREFIQDVLREVDDIENYREEEFEQCFTEFDTDKSEDIQKCEMGDFIKQVAGIDKILERLKK